ncbi:unnamed protein product [Ophioblennius macclurei]
MAHAQDNDSMASEHLTGSEQNLVNSPTPVARGGSNSRALKIAGLTTLVCLLVSSQLFTAYIVFDQKQQLQSLQRTSDKLSRSLTRSSQVRTPMKLQMPMNSLLMNMDLDQEAVPPKPEQPKKPDSGLVKVDKPILTPPKPDFPEIKTKCQIEATAGGAKLGSFRPECDEHGRYMPTQCWRATGFCWCVDETGIPIKDTASREKPQCEGSAPPPTAKLMADPLVA